MPWLSENDAPDYRFWPTGALEFRDRRGRYQRIEGVSGDGYFAFWGDEHTPGVYSRMMDLFQENEQHQTVEQLYVYCTQFRYLCDQCLELSGIDIDWIAPKMLAWLLFAHQSGDTVIEAALVLLNRLSERKHPPLQGGSAVNTYTKLVAAAVNASDGDMGKATELLQNLAAKQFFAVSEELAWQRSSDDDKLKAQIAQDPEALNNRIERSMAMISKGP